MRLSEFRIKNFRSIIDSGWNSVSPDNITTLIGQNESGKSSVLEGLYSFWDGSISEDVLRSDMTLPEISCSYSFGQDEPFDFIDLSRMPEGLFPAIKNKLVITRIWMPDMRSRIIISGEQVSEIFDEIENNELLLHETTIGKIYHALNEYKEIQEEILRLEETRSSLNKELHIIIKKQNKLKKLSKRLADHAKQIILKRETDTAEERNSGITEMIKAAETDIYEKREKIAGKGVFREYGESYLNLVEELQKIKAEVDILYRDLLEIEENITTFTNEKERKAGELKLFRIKEKYIWLSRIMESLSEKAGIRLRLLNNLSEGKNLGEAEREAKMEFDSGKKIYTREQTGELFFSRIPRHEFFEDFSSLLPNRIDLDDIFEKNNKVEGYKAVRNFLIVAGLDPQFFRQTQNRILKQKIENLNHEVTVDFQEYWRQNIGKTNKIRINFELEHYDISHPEKKGKPYLEFWIKDDQERLYPKQRSRGVRWFLSFYLELKAFARENEYMERVLLIDEPGLSLHARAQEDVLKVFEDIKGSIQIIYTTHSPNLIDHNKLYRILAVQRAMEDREQSETLIYDASHLHSATSDTLSPVSSLLGAGFNRQQSSRQTNNVIVEDISSFYYLSSLYAMINKNASIHFLPANGPAGVTTLVNLLIGWGFDFTVLLFDNDDSRSIADELQLQLKGFDPCNPCSRLIIAGNMTAPEDLFSTLDFKKHIINKRMGIPDRNSGFIRENNISRHLLASEFAQSATSGKFSIEAFDGETRGNLQSLFGTVNERFRISDENG